MKNWLSGLLTRRHFLTIAGITAATAACGKAEVRLAELTASVKDKRNRPVVVIGAGLGGLTTAAYLASAWGNPGGGYTGVQIGGRNAFMKLMEDWAD